MVAADFSHHTGEKRRKQKMGLSICTVLFFRLSDLVLFSALFFLRFTFPLWAWLCSCCCSCGCSGGGAVVVVVVVVVQGLLFSSVAAGSGWWVVELVVKFPMLITTQKKSLNSGQKPFSLRISL